ncbi:aminotransferase class I/II-fold pyridoxal phosphate-dependent enzyme [Virgibacillus sp. Bac332]|uniref:aminotransferase class I/II-fold pyridoxal phosphate-dependent enzyme n=1 Tax=Virgibacillus sp. Bac332 TaxID=2419842 RepID=UPI000EF53A7C|nr:aminotransferase class I/II-fold pyridoxal phosphate-dependent enzyme [Virgibacillus sp. Bac332]
MNQKLTPLFSTLQQFQLNQPVSFHVPGHKNGEIFPSFAKDYYSSLLRLDVTELPGLDDLHAPEGAIANAEQLAGDYFQADHTFFLVGGSTTGNLAMVLATCTANDTIIVQRNCHKSIMNALELSGAKPVFIAPEYNEIVDRYTSPSISTLQEALALYPQAKAVVLTYPDYFGKTFNLKKMIDLIHSYHIPVLIDEAHGVHFSLGTPFPESAIALGADIVVQSAHKMAPALTMSAYLHLNSAIVSKHRVAHFLQIIQSSSPSYPIMASLDIARAFLADFKQVAIKRVLASVDKVKTIFDDSSYWRIVPSDDPLKITLQMNEGIAANEVAKHFEFEQIYPELVTHNQLLFIHGLAPFPWEKRLKKAVKSVKDQLKNSAKHDTIKVQSFFPKRIQELALSYPLMQNLHTVYMPFNEAVGHVAAEAVIPYPPGIALILKGEKITTLHIEAINQLRKQGIRMQQRHTDGIHVFTGIKEGEEDT